LIQRAFAARRSQSADLQEKLIRSHTYLLVVEMEEIEEKEAGKEDECTRHTHIIFRLYAQDVVSVEMLV